MPLISMPAEWGTLECSDATEDHFSPSSGWFGVMVVGGSRWRWGSPLMQVDTLATVHLPCRTRVSIPTHHLHLHFPSSFAPCLLVRPPSSHRTLFAHPPPPALLQARHSDKTIAGLWPESWQNLLAPSWPQQTAAGLKSCPYEKETETDSAECKWTVWYIQREEQKKESHITNHWTILSDCSLKECFQF